MGIIRFWGGGIDEEGHYFWLDVRAVDALALLQSDK